MVENFDQLLDRCLDRIAAGEDINRILADYPSEAGRLRPLLLTAVRTNQACIFKTDAETKRAARERFDSALITQRERRRVKQPWFRQLLRPATIAGVATIVVGILIIFASVKTVWSPGTSYQVSDVVPVANPNGNFAFLISDEVNAIANFDNVTVIISKIGLQGSDGKWIEINPTDPSVDLKTVPGDAVKEIWHGDIPADDYHQVFVYVDNVTGILSKTKELIEIKLPSQKLHLSLRFTVSADAVTNFTYDMTVFAIGNGKNSKYMLKPQISESGVQQIPAGNNNQKDKEDSTPNQLPVNKPTPPTKVPKK